MFRLKPFSQDRPAINCPMHIGMDVLGESISNVSGYGELCPPIERLEVTYLRLSSLGITMQGCARLGKQKYWKKKDSALVFRTWFYSVWAGPPTLRPTLARCCAGAT